MFSKALILALLISPLSAYATRWERAVCVGVYGTITASPYARKWRVMQRDGLHASTSDGYWTVFVADGAYSSGKLTFPVSVLSKCRVLVYDAEKEHLEGT